MNTFLLKVIFILTILAFPLESTEHDNGAELIERIENHGWDILTNDWPPSSSSAADNFYFQDDHIDQHNSTDQIDLRKIYLKINESLIKKTMINSTNCIISFKLWFFVKDVQHSYRFPMVNNADLFELYLTLPYGRINLRKLLYDHSKRWNPLRYRIDCEKISEFHIGYYSGLYFLAFKDFRIIYLKKQQLSTEQISQPNSTFISKNFNKDPTNVCLSIGLVSINTTVEIQISYFLQPISFDNQSEFTKFLVPITNLTLNSFKTTSEICLQEFIYFSSQKYTILFELMNKSDVTIISRTNQTTEAPIYFLRSFDQITFHWSKDWFQSNNDDETFDFNDGAIFFTIDCRLFSNNPDKLITRRISSRWIQFDDYNFNSNRIFEYSYQSKNNVFISAQFCTQIGHCSDISIRSIQFTNSSTIVQFQLIKRPQTRLFRLVFIIEGHKSYCHSLSSRLEGSLRLNQGFGDPCHSELFKCKNQGICLSDPSKKTGHCNCQKGFYGNYCENKDFCIYKKECNHPEDCINTKNGATCLCNNKDNKVIWDHMSKSCIKPNVTIKKNLTMPFEYSTNEPNWTNQPLISIDLKTEHLYMKYDFCLMINYSIENTMKRNQFVRLNAAIEHSNSSIPFYGINNLLDPKNTTIQFCLVSNLFAFSTIWEQILNKWDSFIIRFDPESNMPVKINFKSIHFELKKLTAELSQSNSNDYNNDLINTNTIINKTGLFRSETEWYNYAPKLDSIRFEFETSPWFAREKAKRIDGIMYYFRMNESNFEFGSIKLSESLSCIYGQCFLTFNRFSSLSTNENHVFGFKISIEIQFENHTMIKFQLNPLGCQEFNCTGYGECYADYRLGKAARCRCYRGHFGEHCQHHDPCLKGKLFCPKLLNDPVETNQCIPINSSYFECSCSWPNVMEWSNQESCQTRWTYSSSELIFDNNLSQPSSKFLYNVTSIASTIEQYRFNFKSLAYFIEDYRSLRNSMKDSDKIYFTMMSNNSFLDFTLRNKSICFDMQYLSRSSMNQIGIKLSSNDDYLWTNQPNWISDNSSFLSHTDHICAYEWTSQNSNRIVASFSAHLDKNSKTNAKIVALIIKNFSLQINSSEQNNYYLPSWDEHNGSQRLWPIRFPSSVWKNDSNMFNYIGNNNFPDSNHPNSRISYLLSEWITYSSKNHSNIPNKFYFNVKNFSELISWYPIVFNDRMQDITSKISIAISNSSLLEFRLDSFYDQKPIRIGISIVDKRIENDDNTLQILHLDMDDYCRENRCKHSATCLVDFSANKNDYYHCKCPAGFIGTYCQYVNYCDKLNINKTQTNRQLCKNLDLQCVNYENHFRCNCELQASNQYWNDQFSRCVDVPQPFFKQCPDNRIWSRESDKSYKCVCDSQMGYIEDSTSQCIERDACYGNPCGPNGSCSVTFKGDGNYICLCKQGFRQMSNNVYQCEQLNKEEFECPGHQESIEINSMKRCNCSISLDGLLFQQSSDRKFCNLKPICDIGGNGLDKCQQQNALCLIQWSEQYKIQHQCLCPPGQRLIKYGKSESCQDQCQDPSIMTLCAKHNAECDPIGNTLGNHAYHKQNDNWTHFCRCPHGTFISKDGQNCTYSTHVYSMNLTFMWQTLEASVLWTNDSRIIGDANRWLRQQYGNGNQFEIIKKQLRPLLSDFNIQQLFEDFHQANICHNFPLINKQISRIFPKSIERRLEKYMTKYLKGKLFKDVMINLSIENCTKISINNRSSALNCFVGLTIQEDLMKKQNINTILIDQLYNDCNPFLSENLTQCFIDSSYSDELIILGLVEKLNVQKQNPCDINSIKCAPYLGTVCNSNESQIECQCVQFEKYRQLINATGNLYEQNGMSIHKCQLSNDVCAQTCSQDDNFSGHCNWSNSVRKLMIECHCTNNTIYEHYEQTLAVDYGRKFKLIRMNRCLEKDNKMHIELIVIIVVASVVTLVAIISLFLWCRSTFTTRSPNFSDMKYSSDISTNNGSYTLNRTNDLSRNNQLTTINHQLNHRHESIEMPIIRTKQTNLNETNNGPPRLNVIAEQSTSSSSSSDDDIGNTIVLQKSKQIHHSYTSIKNGTDNQREEVINQPTNRMILTKHNLQRKKI